ncbi:MAG: HAD family hydrolase [Chitinispirillaceae bacterium]|nr:HAD family hydrolase [Chitinispirillaceae bacterium]
MRSAITSDIGGIIFDLDGTLYRMEPFFQPLMFFSLLPHPFRLLHFLAERSKLSGRDFGTREQLLDVLCTHLSKRLNVNPDSLHRWIADRFYPAFIAAMRFQRRKRDGMKPMLEHLHGSGIRLAVLSDYHAVEERLSMLRIPAEYFDPVSSCESAGALKPAPRPFTEIARSWELPADRILVVGDRDDTDGKAAQNAGMRFIRITDKKKRGKAQRELLNWPALCTCLRAL